MELFLAIFGVITIGVVLWALYEYAKGMST